MIKIKQIDVEKKVEETTQVSDVGTHKKSVLPLMQVKFKDYNIANGNKDSVWNIVSKVLGIPKSNINMDTSHLDKHTINYSRPLSVSYNLDVGSSPVEVDKSMAIRGAGALKAEIEKIEGVEQVWDLISNTKK